MTPGSYTSNNPEGTGRCAHKFRGVVMSPLAYPSVGWEPIHDSDECELYAGHPGRHRGKRIEWDHPTEESRVVA